MSEGMSAGSAHCDVCVFGGGVGVVWRVMVCARSWLGMKMGELVLRCLGLIHGGCLG